MKTGGWPKAALSFQRKKRHVLSSLHQWQGHALGTHRSRLLGHVRRAGTQHHGTVRSCRRDCPFSTYPPAFFSCSLLGLPKLSAYPKKYLFLGIPTANVCSVCFCLSLYLSDGGQQTVEVGMVNYLWPCLVVLFAVLFSRQKARWWIAPGVVISFLGVMLVLGGERGIQPAEIWMHVQNNPWSYVLAFFGAVAWAACLQSHKGMVQRTEPHAHRVRHRQRHVHLSVDCRFRRHLPCLAHRLGERRHRGRGHGRFLRRMELRSQQKATSPFSPLPPISLRCSPVCSPRYG